MMTVKRKVHFVRRERGRKTVADAPRPAEQIKPGRIPRISRLMALAIRYDHLIREGKVSGIAELARLAHVTQPRMTQIMNLNHLAPDIQEVLLTLPPVETGRERTHEHALRVVCKSDDWKAQRETWFRIRPPGDHRPGRKRG